MVTGGAGFIGSALVRDLLRTSGATIVNVDKLTYSGNLDSLDKYQAHKRHHFEQADICDQSALGKIFRKYQPSSVIHLAAESHVDRSIDKSENFINTNVLGTHSLLEESRKHYEKQSEPERDSFRFLHVSTDEVYGALKLESPTFTETHPYDPHSPYSASKAASDHLARAWHATYGLPVIVTNCSNNYGPYQFPEKLIPLVILKCLREEEIPIYGEGKNVRDWIYVYDHVDALKTVLRKGVIGRSYNIGGNSERSNLDIVSSLCKILDGLRPLTADSKVASYSELITFVADRPGHDFRYGVDASRVRDELGWAPREELQNGLQKTVGWYLENQKWWKQIIDAPLSLQRLGSGH